MIRVNLLPRELRRRRLVLPRELVVLASMVLGWALLVSVGFFWISDHQANVGRLLDEAAALDAEAARQLGKLENSKLADLQATLQARRDALSHLRAARRTPLASVSELVALFDAAPPVDGAPASGDAPLRLLELRVTSPTAWNVVGSARDAAALADLVRRLKTSDRFDLSYGPEYARTEGDRLRFRVDLAVRPETR